MMKLRMKQLQHDMNIEAAKLSALSSGRNDKHEYLTGDEVLKSDQRRIIEQAKLTYSCLGKAFEKETKTVEEQGKRQIDAITNQNKRLYTLTNKDDHKSFYEKIFQKLVKKKNELMK